MRLTKYHKEAIIAAIMQDPPKPPRDLQAEYQAAVMADMIAVSAKTLPALSVALKDKQLRPFLLTGYNSVQPSAVTIGNRSYYGRSVGLGSAVTYMGYAPSDDLNARSEEIMVAAVEEMLNRDALESKVSGVVNSCSTRKALLDLVPEFEKYLPEEPTKGTMLPALANLAADLVKAGWPAGKTA